MACLVPEVSFYSVEDLMLGHLWDPTHCVCQVEWSCLVVEVYRV